MRELRLAVRLSIPALADVLDMRVYALRERDCSRVPWQLEEIAAAKAKIVAHQNAVSLALDKLES